MKLLRFVFTIIYQVFFTSADPNLFGSRKRRKEKEKLSKEARGYAAETQGEIEALQAQNPFESAAAKSAMAQSARRSKQMATRYANMMGAGATPEAMIASQQAVTEGAGATAGQIAVGAEAQKQAQLNALRQQKMAQQSQAIGLAKSAAEERGSGWNTLFQGMSAFGSMLSGASQAGKAFM